MEKIYPLKFLDSYKADDSDYFFGRNEEINQLYKMVFESDLILVFGESGTGKSSLIQSGLASRFKVFEWLPIYISRGLDINDSLKKSLEKEIPNKYGEMNPSNKRTKTSLSVQGNSITRKLHTICENNFRPVYLIFDQLEELFILGTKDEQLNFIQIIKDILKYSFNTKIIFILREEYYGRLTDFEKEVPVIFRKRIRIEPMNLYKVTQVIKGIANLEKSLIKIEQDKEKEIAEKIFNIIKSDKSPFYIELPYLQVFLDHLYISKTKDENRQVETLFSEKDFQSKINFEDILQSFLDKQVIQAATEFNLEDELIWDFLKELVSIEGTKVPVSREEYINKLSKLENLPPSINKNSIENCITFFDKKRIIKVNKSTHLIELYHDTLAKRINTKRTPDELKKLEVERMIANVLKSSINTKRDYFTIRQLNIIAEQKKLLISSKDRDWIKKSKEHHKWIFIRNLVASAVLFSIIGSVIFLFIKNINQKYILEKEQNYSLTTLTDSLTTLTDSLTTLTEKLENKNKKVIDLSSIIYSKNKDLEKKNETLAHVRDSLKKSNDSINNLLHIGSVESQGFQDSIEYLLLSLDSIFKTINKKNIKIKELEIDLEKQLGDIKKQKNLETELYELNKQATQSKIIPQDERWVKEGFFLLFGNIKVSLRKLNTKNNEAIFLICEADFKKQCIEGAKVISLNPGLSKAVNISGNIYNISLNKIAHAGKNPLTKAAYINFGKKL